MRAEHVGPLPEELRPQTRIAPQFRREIDAEMKQWATLTAVTASNKLVRGAAAVPGKAHPRLLTSRSGMSGLAGTIAGEMVRSGEVSVGSSSEYARVHEEGRPAVIRPRTRRWLTIPTREALTKGGRIKRPGARAYGDLVFWQKAPGSQTAFLMHRDTWRAFFVLKKRVRTKARPFLWPVIERRLPDLDRRLSQYPGETR